MEMPVAYKVFVRVLNDISVKAGLIREQLKSLQSRAPAQKSKRIGDRLLWALEERTLRSRLRELEKEAAKMSAKADRLLLEMSRREEKRLGFGKTQTGHMSIAGSPQVLNPR
jgi:hypothetical protein